MLQVMTVVVVDGTATLLAFMDSNRLPNHQKGCPIHLVIRLDAGNCAPIELFSAELRDTCQGPCGFGCEIDRMVNDAGALLITHLEQMIVRYKTTFGWRDSPSRGTCLC